MEERTAEMISKKVETFKQLIADKKLETASTSESMKSASLSYETRFLLSIKCRLNDAITDLQKYIESGCIDEVKDSDEIDNNLVKIHRIIDQYIINGINNRIETEQFTEI